jgi:hypothetical protein
MNNRTTEINKVIFTYKDPEIKDPLIFIHYFASKEDISQFKNHMTITYFETVFSIIAGDPVTCNQCFKIYLEKNNVTLVNFIVN